MKKTTLTIVALSALLVLSLGGNGYQYIQLKTANTTIAANAAQLEQQTAEITRLSELLKEQTTEINTLTAKLEQAVKDMSMNSNKPGLTDIEQEAYDMLIDMGLTPEAAMEALTGTPQTDPSDGTGGTAPPVNNGGTTPPINNGDTTPPVNNGGNKPTTPNKPAGGNGGTPWGDVGMTEEEYRQWQREKFGDDWADNIADGTHVNPEDLEGIS